jgi:hypothetical protein
MFKREFFFQMQNYLNSATIRQTGIIIRYLYTLPLPVGNGLLDKNTQVKKIDMMTIDL